jgi:hypothetical protein
MSQQNNMFRSVMSIFGGAPKATGTPDINPTVPNKDTPLSDGKGPKAIPAVKEGEASPLDGYAKLWEHADTDGKPISLNVPLEADPAKLLAAAKTVDFTKAMNPELLDKASKGDSAALGQLVNEAAQTGYAQSALATTKIVEAALAKQADMFKTSVMPEILRRHNIGNELGDNPLFDNPAVKPLLDGLKNQLAIKYKDATPAQIKEHAEKILTEMATSHLKSSGKTVSDGAALNADGTLITLAPAKEFNWEEHFLGKKQPS